MEALIRNKKWYAENGTVYNYEDDKFLICCVALDKDYKMSSYMNLEEEQAEKIADIMNDEKYFNNYHIKKEK